MSLKGCAQGTRSHRFGHTFGNLDFMMIFSVPQKHSKSHGPFLNGPVSHAKNNIVRTNKRTPIRRKHIHQNM